MRNNVQGRKTQKMTCMLIFQELRDSSMSFTPILLKLHTIQFMECILRNTTQFTRYHGQQHDIPVPKGVTPFARTASSWEHAFPGTPGMHTTELRVHNQNTHHRCTKFT